MYNSKVNTKITFPLNDLNMCSFVRESTLENMITEYDLVAIISHRGSGMECIFFICITQYYILNKVFYFFWKILPCFDVLVLFFLN